MVAPKGGIKSVKFYVFVIQCTIFSEETQNQKLVVENEFRPCPFQSLRSSQQQQCSEHTRGIQT